MVRDTVPPPSYGPLDGTKYAGIRYASPVNDYVQRLLVWFHARNLGYAKGHIYIGTDDGLYHCTVCPYFRTIRVIPDRANVIPWATVYFEHWELHTQEVLDRIDELPDEFRNDLVKLMMDAEFTNGGKRK